ncbi:hypothetical protein [Limnohabitans sp.]|uniref:hypothetical protein n=1 Tax=Limnohabitans sp. TaxID=1907725 RepID=UPI0038BA1238
MDTTHLVDWKKTYYSGDVSPWFSICASGNVYVLGTLNDDPFNSPDGLAPFTNWNGKSYRFDVVNYQPPFVVSSIDSLGNAAWTHIAGDSRVNMVDLSPTINANGQGPISGNDGSIFQLGLVSIAGSVDYSSFEIFHFSKDGSHNWIKTINASPDQIEVTAGLDGSLYTNQLGEITKYNNAGIFAWKIKLPDTVFNDGVHTYATANGGLYCTSPNGFADSIQPNILLLNSNGTIAWGKHVDQEIETSAIGKGGEFYFSYHAQEDSGLVISRLNLNGAQAWSTCVEKPHTPTETYALESGIYVTSITGEVSFVESLTDYSTYTINSRGFGSYAKEAWLTHLNADGTKAWSDSIASVPLQVLNAGDGAVYLVAQDSSSKVISRYNQDGSEAWVTHVASGATVSTDESGSIYVVDDGGQGFSVSKLKDPWFSNVPPTGSVAIYGTAEQGKTLTAQESLSGLGGTGSIGYQWLADGNAISGATENILTLSQAEVGKSISVKALFSSSGNVNSVTSTGTDSVANVNDAPTGEVNIQGDAIQGQVLTANNTLADIDGLGTISFQWLADGSPIRGATTSTLTLTQAQVGKVISVKASYIDLQGTAESMTSSTTASVADVNDAPTGGVNIRGIPTPGKTLTAVNTLADIDGMGTISYQWLLDGVNINGANSNALTLTQAQVGKAISVKASYTDGGGWFESVSSDSLLVAKNYTNSAPENTKNFLTTFTVSDLNLFDPANSKFPLRPALIGADAKFFKLVTQGSEGSKLKFGLILAAALDFEQPVDSNHDGIYEVSVVMTNAKTGYKVVKDLTVGVEFAPILGTAKNDNLKGTPGFDTLDGLAGDDTLAGGLGLDTFLVSSGHDTILDFNCLTKGANGSEVLQVSAGAVADVRAFAAWTATADSFNDGIANLTTKFSVDLSAINHGLGWNVTNMGTGTTIQGSQFDDVLVAGKGNVNLMGGAGNDVLYFGTGKNNLTGGSGADTFRMSMPYFKQGALNHISDFLSGTDRIEIDHTLFRFQSTGQLDANQFSQGTVSPATAQGIVYDNSTGNLFYKIGGSAKAVLIGVLDNHAQLAHTDLWIV